MIWSQLSQNLGKELKAQSQHTSLEGPPVASEDVKSRVGESTDTCQESLFSHLCGKIHHLRWRCSKSEDWQGPGYGSQGKVREALTIEENV
jgi:hypothetical protein